MGTGPTEIEGRAFDDVDNWYDRLPADVTTNVNGGVHSMKHHTAGMQFRFATDSRRLVFNWNPFYEKLAADHMPASGCSGIDVYRFDALRGKWLYVKTGRIADAKDGIMKYALDYNHIVDYERGYTIRHQRNAKAYDWIMRNMSGKPAVGVRIYESLHKLRDAEIQEKDADSTAIFWQFGSPAGKLIADASIPTVYEGEGICGAAFGENVKQVPNEAFARGLIVDWRGAELLEEMGVSVGLREKGAAASETFFYENADGGRFFVVNFDTGAIT